MNLLKTAGRTPIRKYTRGDTVEYLCVNKDIITTIHQMLVNTLKIPVSDVISGTGRYGHKEYTDNGVSIRKKDAHEADTFLSQYYIIRKFGQDSPFEEKNFYSQLKPDNTKPHSQTQQLQRIEISLRVISKLGKTAEELTKDIPLLLEDYENSSTTEGSFKLSSIDVEDVSNGTTPQQFFVSLIFNSSFTEKELKSIIREVLYKEVNFIEIS